MSLGASLYLGAELTSDDLAWLLREWDRPRPRRMTANGTPSNGLLNVWRDGVPVIVHLIRPGVFGDFLLTNDLPEEFAVPPRFTPRSMLTFLVSTSPIDKAHVGLRLVIELAADCARRWPCRLSNDGDREGFRIYTPDEIIDAERQGKQLE
jgi:hypothetical protein